jgi:hypothetical protein
MANLYDEEEDTKDEDEAIVDDEDAGPDITTLDDQDTL